MNYRFASYVAEALQLQLRLFCSVGGGRASVT